MLTEINSSDSVLRPTFDTQVHSNSWTGAKPPEVREATDKLKAEPRNVELMLSLGQELSRAGFFRDAIDVYSRGMLVEPDNHLLFRHRGHRYISVRRYHEAVADLSQAARLRSGFWETYYHLGLAHYLLGEYSLAEEAYRQCLDATESEKRLCAVVDWYYLTLMMLGKTDEAKTLAGKVNVEADAGENEAYKQRIMVYRGILSPETALSQLETDDDHAYCTRVYGIGMEYYFRGDKEKAKAVFQNITKRSSWWHGFAELAVIADRDRLCL